MKRQDFFPPRISQQSLWCNHFGAKLPEFATVLGVSPEDTAAAVADALWAGYVLGPWLTAVRAFSPSTTDSVDEALTGDLLPDPDDAITMPIFTAPTPGPGVAPQPPGVLTRLFALIASIKTAPGYSEPIGIELKIVGAEDTESKAVPRFLITVQQGSAGQVVKITFYKYGHQGAYMESRRGPNGVWEFLAIDTESPYVDERPLLVAGQPEVREYRMRFWDKGTPNGEWTDVAKVTLAP